jgi:hypothetical protein
LFHENFETPQLLYPEIVVKSVSEERRGKEETLYFSVVEIAKSVRERCILVAAIVIAISEGSRNICIADEYEGLPRHNIQERTRLSGSGMNGEFVSIYHSTLTY